MQGFSSGPFGFAPGASLTVAGEPRRRWTLGYGRQELAERTLPADATAGQIKAAFADDLTAFALRAAAAGAPPWVALVDETTGLEIGGFAGDVSDMTPGLIDDRSRFWLRSADRLRSRPVTIDQYGKIAAACAAPPRAWIVSLLPDDVLTTEPAQWRAPTSWEIRHVVGEGSFTGITGANAAALVGVQPQGFRKYTAADGASSRQSMGFAMWHLLLHRLGVQRLA